MSSEKPREWWINNLGAEDWIEGPIAETSEPIHVIEKSAYDAVVAERDEIVKIARQAQDACFDLYRQKCELQLGVDQLKAELAEMTKNADTSMRNIWDALNQRDRPKARLDRLLAAMEFIKIKNGCAACASNAIKWKEALAEIFKEDI